jgi:tetratricopeptide (TPR) repeat protein
MRRLSDFPVKISTGAVLAVGFAIGCVGLARSSEPEDQLEALQRAQALTTQKKWPEAATAWQRVVDVNPHLGEAWLGLGIARQENKDYHKAIAAFGKSLELRYGYPFGSAYRIARCHALLGEKEQALEWLQKALDLGLRNLQLLRDQEDFRALRDDDRFKKMAAIVDVSSLLRDEGWRVDLDLLAREIKRTHYAPFRNVTREQFEEDVRKLKEEIPRMSDNQIIVGFKKLLRRVGDGHTNLRVYGDGAKTLPPLEFFLFSEGLFITAVDQRFAGLAGAQVLRVGGHPVEEVVHALDAVIPQDNSMGLLWRAPAYLRSPKVLNGLGVIPDDKSLPLTICDTKGQEREVVLPADSGEPRPTWVSAREHAGAPEPLYLKNLRQAYWFEYLPDQKLVYFQYNAVANQGKETLEQFCKRLFRFIEEHEVSRLVIDLRWNGGGNNFLNEPLIHGLIRCDKVNQQGKLFAIVGRNTFSAAMCGAQQIERHTKAIFVGEPTGSSPNFIGESAVNVRLPYCKLRASISDLYWQNSVAMDYRTWIAPPIYAPPTFALFRANRDPAMEAILAYKGTKEK